MGEGRVLLHRNGPGLAISIITAMGGACTECGYCTRSLLTQAGRELIFAAEGESALADIAAEASDG